MKVLNPTSDKAKLDMTNTVKQKLKEGRKTCGAFLQTLSPVAAEILAHAGFDWLIVDLEHTPGSYENLQSQLQAMSGTDVVPFSRAHRGTMWLPSSASSTRASWASSFPM